MSRLTGYLTESVSTGSKCAESENYFRATSKKSNASDVSLLSSFLEKAPFQADLVCLILASK